MSKRPSRPLADCVSDFNLALDQNRFDDLIVCERALDAVVQKRLRQMSYTGYKYRELERLLSELPVDYQSPVLDRLLELMDSKTTAERVEHIK